MEPNNCIEITLDDKKCANTKKMIAQILMKLKQLYGIHNTVVESYD